MSKPLKILYLAAANYTGTLDQFVEEHRRRGRQAEFVTLAQSAEGFNNGICFNIWPNGGHKTLLSLHGRLAQPWEHRHELPGSPPFYAPSVWRKLFQRLQDTVYKKRILSMIEKHGLMDFDVYHLEGGIDFFKDFRILPELKNRGKKLIANYHGNDFRNRGVYPVMHQLADANLSSEWDIYFRYPGCLYLHLPVKFHNETAVNQDSRRIIIAHRVRNRSMYAYKGTEEIIRCAQEAIKGRNAEFRLICGLPHSEAQAQLAGAHILVDQIGGKAGWGYGMSAVEALSKGIVVCVEIQNEIEGVLAGHPFVNVNQGTLTERLITLMEDTGKRIALSEQGRAWARRTHSIQGVVDRLYGIYKEKLCIG